jgi:pyruvate dehydrogenase complex dehydrogenase (E1) component
MRLRKVINVLDCLFNEQKLVRRSLVVWSIWQVTMMLSVARENWLELTGVHATVIASVMTLLTIGFNHYQWSRGREDERK